LRIAAGPKRQARLPSPGRVRLSSRAFDRPLEWRGDAATGPMSPTVRRRVLVVLPGVLGAVAAGALMGSLHVDAWPSRSRR